MKRILLSLVFIFYFAALVSAQEYGFDLWTTANGLPQNTVNGITQTPDGYLWLSTFDGLARFDGVRFTIFDKGNSPGIATNRFASILSDREGSVWAVAENGMITVYQAGVFTSYPFASSINDSALIVGIMADAQGNAVFESDEHYYRLQDGKITLASDQKQKNVNALYFGKSGAKWLISFDQITQTKNGQTTIYPVKIKPIAPLGTKSFLPFEDSKGALWLQTQEHQLRRLHDGVATIYTEKEIPELKEYRQGTYFNEKDGSLLIFFWDPAFLKPSRLVRFKDEQFTSSDLPGVVSANSGFTDREGVFWLPTAKGLRRMRRQLITTISIKDGLSYNEVYPILQTASGSFFIGTAHGLNRSDGGKIRDLKFNYPGLQTPLVMSGLWEDQRGRVWLGFDGGFGRIENDSYKIISRQNIPRGASDFVADKTGNVWIATGEGIYVLDKDDKEITHYTIADGLPHNQIVTLHFDPNGNLWVGTFNGLARLVDGKFINYNEVENSPHGYVRAIYEDGDGTLWFGTYSDGLVRLKDGKFFNYQAKDGLFNNGVFALLEDHHNNLWMSSNRGIYRVGKQELDDFAAGKIPKLNSVSYNESDGMLNVECNGGRLPAAIKTSDGKFWFATMGGVTIIDPETEQVNQNPPPVVIETVEVDRKPIEPKFLYSTIHNPQSAIEMQPGQSNLEITYTGLSLIKSEQIKFKYRLEGFEENWTEAGTTRRVNYSYLPAGNYTFHVIAANANGVWNNQGASFKVIVHPYFYQTLWFRSFVSLAVVFVIGFLYYNRVAKLRQIAETKTAFSRQLIESQEAERKRLAAELHDGLGQNLVVIKNRATLGINKGDDRERVAKELHNISESASQALDEVREITNNLRPQLLDRLGLTKAINAMLKKVSGVIEIKSDIDSIDGLFNETQEINIYRIVQESLNNIVKHANSSQALVQIKRDENRVLILIEDHGTGFDAGNVKISDSGFGLIGLKERTQLLNGDFSFDSKIGEGTSIKVRVPIQKQ